MKFLLACLLLPTALLAGCSSKPASPSHTATPAMSHSMSMSPSATSSDPIASARSAAPAAVSKDASVVTMDAKGMLKTVRKGTNGWTCMPDNPESPGPDPMCVDQGGWAWIQAWAAHKTPPAGTMGFGYMLMGAADADNDDPYAMKPPAGKSWVKTGPHVMIFNVGSSFAGYPKTADNTKAPYVMFPDTPYAHLMIPVQ
jgi:hypothetical protein